MRMLASAFWDEKVQWREDGDRVGNGRVVRVGLEGQIHHYVVYPYVKTRNHTMLGLGGALCVFRLLDGEVLISNNVWSQDEVPEEYRELLPPNATALFCSCGRWQDVGGHIAFGEVAARPCECCRLVTKFAATWEESHG